ncbi:MAG: contractile injection system tape measure protein, partial [Longimicrobiaceae bacterium]
MSPVPPASRFGPSVRAQRLEVEAGSQVVAMALQPRLSDLNRRRLLPVIERVLRELDVPGRQVRIERLSVDLGTVSLSALDAELPRLLERELRRALAAALNGGDREAGVRARPLAQARAELLEHHLLRGTLPFWAPPGTSLASLVGEMAAAEPARLAGVVRRLGTRTGVVERLVGQLDDRGLARLVRVLEPEHAALVLAYVGDLRRTHRSAPLLPLSERRFGRHLWTLVQAYLVHDPGSEFNRRSFVGSLLRGMSRGHGLSYTALLATLARGLALTRRRRAVRSSLPAVVGELLREARAAGEPIPGGEAEGPSSADGRGEAGSGVRGAR